MYRKRKKDVAANPQASSTLKDTSKDQLGSFTSTQSSVISSIDENKRSCSPDDMFIHSPKKDISMPSTSSMNPLITSPVQKKASQVKNKATTAELMDMLVSSDDSEPLPKIARLNLTSKVQDVVLSQTINSTPKQYLEEVLLNSGMVLGKHGAPNLLKKSQAIFVRNLQRVVEKDSTGQKSIDKFMENLDKYFTDPDCLKSALLPTKTDSDACIPGDLQESLIRLLLLVESLQVRVIAFLLDKIGEYAAAAEDDAAENDEAMGTVRMILQAMRYLNKLVEPENLTDKLFDILHSVSSSLLKHEIINCLPDIISDAQREKTANELIELMKIERDLTPSVLFTLSNLWLNDECLYQLQMNLIRSLRKTSLDQLPAFIRFITMGNIINHADEIINGLRSELTICQTAAANTQLRNSTSTDLPSTLLLIFEKLRDSVLKSKKLADIWLKNISKVKTSANHKPIDIVMLIILHSMSQDLTKKKSVELVFKNKIKIGHFKEDLIRDTLSVACVIIKEHFDGLMKLLSCLLQSPDLTVSSFSSYFYIECFHKLDTYWRKMIILELKDNVTICKGNMKTALNLLHNLTSKYTSEVAPYVTLIMLLLDVVPEMKVVEVRELMDVICMIAFGDLNTSSIDNHSIQDEIGMIVQKQISCPDPSIFRCGIVSGIVTIKHMVKKGENESNETPSSNEEEIPLSLMAKKALHLLELVLAGTRAKAEAQVLAFDQLSYISMNSDNMDKAFMKKVSLLMQTQLQNNFVVASSDYSSKDNGLDASLQYCIDTDFEDPIVFNLVDAVMMEVNNSQIHIPIAALPGLVRVVRGLELSDLTEIDALLGCAISLPSPGIYSKFNCTEPLIQRVSLDCLFHACNWLREMLNCFVYQVKEGTPEKILKRLRAIVYLQNLISVCLPQAYSYSPPNCYFDYSGSKPSSQSEKPKKAPPTRKKTKNGKKGEKEKGDNDESVENDETVETDEEKEEELISLEYGKFKQHLRELDFDVCLVLTQPLTMVPKMIKDGDCSAELGPSELMFVLDDLNSKLRYCLNSKKKFPGRKEPVGFDNLSTVSLDLILRNTSKLAHHLTSHLHKIVEYLHNLITMHDGILDAAGMFCPGSGEMKLSLALIFSIFNAYLSWPDLSSETYNKCLLKTLVKLAGPNIDKKEITSINYVINAALLYLNDISKCILDLPSTVGLVNLMKTLIDLQEDEEGISNLNLGDLCEDFLKRKWYDLKGQEVKGTLANQQQSLLLDIYFSDKELSLINISNTLSWLSLECESLRTDSSLTTFPHFNKTNLNVLIRSICKGLLTGAKKKLEVKDVKEQLEVWDSVVNSLQETIAIIKVHDLRINLRQFLKGCLPLLRFFLSNGMSVCSTMFKIESVTVSQTIKKLQVVTRYIQSICNYSKLNKDNSLIQQLPGIRGILETILLSVKNMVLQNKCTGAFFMGSMRNKDIHGEIISSQDANDGNVVGSEETPPIPEEPPTDATANDSDTSDDSNTASMSDAC